MFHSLLSLVDINAVSGKCRLPYQQTEDVSVIKPSAMQSPPVVQFQGI